MFDVGRIKKKKELNRFLSTSQIEQTIATCIQMKVLTNPHNNCMYFSKVDHNYSSYLFYLLVAC